MDYVNHDVFLRWYDAYLFEPKNLGMLNSRFTLIIAWAISAFYVVLMRTYFESIPDSLGGIGKD